MNQAFLPNHIYRILFALLGIVYITGLFVPLLDNDSAHHANIALHMYLTGDYVSLIDQGRDYLDKPHLLFWLSAASYHLFGVNAFAYKFPSFLFTILGTYSTYRLGKTLYNRETGKLAALIVASAFAYLLANNDVRMDAILTASVIFATWQLVDWIHHGRFIHVVGSALGLAIGFCTKGHIAVFVPGIGILFYLVYLRNWKPVFSLQFLSMILLFFVFISPVVYCYYLQYDLHPEKIIRGQSGRSGVKFILWEQNFERFKGDSFGGAGKNDRLFFFHSFLWAFAPWSIITYMAFFSRLKSFINRRFEWLTIGSFLVMAILISLSGFKLPHYLNIIFPASAVLTASYLLQKSDRPKTLRTIFTVQLVTSLFCLLLIGLINAWSFPVSNIWVMVGLLAFLVAAVMIYKPARTRLDRLITVSVCTSVVVFYLLNTNFYPQLLTYQGGNEIAKATEGKVDPKTVYFWPSLYSPSYIFTTQELKKDFSDSVMNRPGPVWVLTDNKIIHLLEEKSYPFLEKYAQRDYHIGALQWEFINPATRKQVLDTMYLVRVK